MMGSVIEKINDLGVEVHHIPGGYTGLCQPIDVGYNCPFKYRLQWLWEMWMVREGLLNDVVQSPTWAEVVRWIVMAQVEMTIKIIENSWLYSPNNQFEVEEWCFKNSITKNDFLKLKLLYFLIYLSQALIPGIFQADCYLLKSPSSSYQHDQSIDQCWIWTP